MLTRSFCELADLLTGRRTLVLSGAGCSTESGIPDYRGPASRGRDPRPVRYQEFVRDASARRRYWAGSALGWPRIEAARPNRGHLALARLEAAGRLSGIVTQNVDGLHQAAGSRRVIELHGSLSRVRCLACDARETRRHLQRRILVLNPAWPRWGGASGSDEADPKPPRGLREAPDGDTEVSAPTAETFRPADCRRCGGVLKPDVVFFGENVPRERVEEALGLLKRSDGLLVAGSSLAVYSGYRFVLEASRGGKAVAIVNLGPTRADEVATVKVVGRTGEVLPALAELLA